MKVASDEKAEAGRVKNAHFMAIGVDSRVDEIEASLSKVKTWIKSLATDAEPSLLQELNELDRKIARFEPSVTMLGQVKAGKTALVNALAGQVGFLPSDVNPWTSVVTTIHLNQKLDRNGTRSKFTFFDRQEWAQLVNGGGRLGELADRTGRAQELDTIKRQIEEMQANARARLSNNFEAILGKCHRYGYCDRELIERYVCLGDPDEIEEDPGSKQGRFADITRSADVYIDAPHLKMSLSLRDTPGVNDTFMVREQITIQALQSSELCVVVLSAHEALNTTDLALLRMISTLERSQVILFVNRIDELYQPSVQVPEIRRSILATLQSAGLTEDIKLVFGSARWAEVALTGDLGLLDEEDKRIVIDWAEACETDVSRDTEEFIWRLSGLPELSATIVERIHHGAGARLTENVLGVLSNLSQQIELKRNRIATDMDSGGIPQRRQNEASEKLNSIGASSRRRLSAMIEENRADLHKSLCEVKDNYVKRATETLKIQIQDHGTRGIWTLGSDELRWMLRANYLTFCKHLTGGVESVFAETAYAIEEIYAEVLAVPDDDFSVVPPVVPQLPPAVSLGRTIAVDLGANWWKSWWQRRRGVDVHIAECSSMIETEVEAMIKDLETEQLDQALKDIQNALDKFLKDQRSGLVRLVAATREAPGKQEESRPEHTSDINEIRSTLRAFYEARKRAAAG